MGPATGVGGAEGAGLTVAGPSTGVGAAGVEAAAGAGVGEAVINLCHKVILSMIKKND